MARYFHKLRQSDARSGAWTPFKEMRIFAPLASSNSNVHSHGPTDNAALS
jgi:hypothetical protein